MIEDGEVRPEGCICEPCSYIPKLEGYTNQVRIYYVRRKHLEEK
jgi:hypothetical protein